jgi:hypothetical protein
MWEGEEELQVKILTTWWVLNMERNAVNVGEKQKVFYASMFPDCQILR